MRELFEDDYESCADEAAPVRVPRIVDYGRIGWYAHCWLFRIDLVVAVPASILGLVSLQLAVHDITIERMHYGFVLR